MKTHDVLCWVSRVVHQGRSDEASRVHGANLPADSRAGSPFPPSLPCTHIGCQSMPPSEPATTQTQGAPGRGRVRRRDAWVAPQERMPRARAAFVQVHAASGSDLRIPFPSSPLLTHSFPLHLDTTGSSCQHRAELFTQLPTVSLVKAYKFPNRVRITFVAENAPTLAATQAK